jgi:hypothetical protein
MTRAPTRPPSTASTCTATSKRERGAGGLLVGWGSLPDFSEFSPSGTLLLNAEFPAGVNSYRAYRFDWNPGRR